MTRGHGVFVIAEAGSNWRMGTPHRDLIMARRLVDVASEAGADAVKFQTYRSRSVYVPDAGAVDLDGVTAGSINAVFDDLEMPYELIPRIAEYCVEVGIEFMSTPFSVDDGKAVDPFVVRHKIASYEINHVRLIEHLARAGKPLIMSTGAATEEDVAFGLDTVRASGATEVTLMHCTASYPAPPDSLNLAAIPYLRERFGVPVGLSDHSRDPIVAPVAAVALGAVAIEKHYTIDRRLPGPDHPFALQPSELAQMVRAIRLADLAVGEEGKIVQPAEQELRGFAVRAIQAVRDIAPGEPLVEGYNFDVLRPGKRSRGLHPRHLGLLRGRHSARSITAGDGITGDAIDPPLP
ncbi:MAG: N-acetylneuraminate synthase family protein [Candidatus Limnocylindrales bacterium]